MLKNQKKSSLNIFFTKVSNNTILLMTIDKFDLNSILVNINKLEPYRFVKDHTFQPTLSKLNNIIKIIN